MASLLECAASAKGATGSEAPAAESSAGGGGAPGGGGDLLRMVLVGKTGEGRSASANSIVGRRRAFRVALSPCSATTRCQMQTATAEVDGAPGGRRRRRSVAVVDTPGFFHTRLSPQAVAAEVGRCVALAAPGPHVFLLTVRLGRFTHEERDTLEWIKATFGPEATRFTVVLFTWGDQLKGRSIRDFLKESAELTALVDGCRGGCHVFDNSGGDADADGGDRGQEDGASSQQVAALLDKVEKMVAANGGACYSADMFREAERAVRVAQEGILAARAGMPTWRSVEDQEEEEEEEKEEEPGGKAKAAAGTELERRKRTEEEEEEEQEEERRRGRETARKTEEKLFWCELMAALGKGAAEGAGIMGKDKGSKLKKGKVVQRAAALAANPLTVSSAAKVVGGAVREGSKVLYKHRKTLLH